MLVSSYHDPDEHDPNPLNIDYDEDPVYYNKATKYTMLLKLLKPMSIISYRLLMLVSFVLFSCRDVIGDNHKDD